MEVLMKVFIAAASTIASIALFALSPVASADDEANGFRALSRVSPESYSSMQESKLAAVQGGYAFSPIIWVNGLPRVDHQAIQDFVRLVRANALQYAAQARNAAQQSSGATTQTKVVEQHFTQSSTNDSPGNVQTSNTFNYTQSSVQTVMQGNK
jgi:hypothetical protein